MESRTVINIDEPIGKVVGRRRPPTNPLGLDPSNKMRVVEWMRALPVQMPRRGVYRFKSHEDATLWMMNQTGKIRF